MDGGTVWKCVSSKGATQTITTTQTTAGGAVDQVLRIECQPTESGVLEVKFFVDGAQLKDAATGRVFKHTVTHTSAVAMALGVYAKAGGATSEVPEVDYLACEHLR